MNIFRRIKTALTEGYNEALQEKAERLDAKWTRKALRGADPHNLPDNLFIKVLDAGGEVELLQTRGWEVVDVHFNTIANGTSITRSVRLRKRLGGEALAEAQA